jgi:hypothetical protein
MDTHKNAPLTPTAAINTLTTDRKGAAWQEVDSGSTIARCRSTGPSRDPAPCPMFRWDDDVSIHACPQV